MTQDDSKDTKPAPRKPRAAKPAAAKPAAAESAKAPGTNRSAPLDRLPVERSLAKPRATAAGKAAPPVLTPVPVMAQPDIDEDGAWIEADAVEVHQSAIGRVDATDVAVTQGAVGAARADRVSVEMGALGAALAGEVSVSQGAVGTVIAQHARVEQAVVRTLIAQDVAIHRPSAVIFLLAQRVSGDVKVLLDWRGALAFGAAFGAIAGLLRRARRGR